MQEFKQMKVKVSEHYFKEKKTEIIYFLAHVAHCSLSVRRIYLTSWIIQSIFGFLCLIFLILSLEFVYLSCEVGLHYEITSFACM